MRYFNCLKTNQGLKEIAKKVYLHISFKKMEFMTNVKFAPKYFNAKCGKIKKIHQLKFLEGLIKESDLEKNAKEARCRI